MGLITASLVQIFLPFNANIDLAIAGFSVMIFSGFILYDTQQIMKRLSVDEAILGECVWVCRGGVPGHRATMGKTDMQDL
jgi:FtsH-binding integral membrane protein